MSDSRERRLDELREEAARTGRVEAAGVHAHGGPLPPQPTNSPREGRPLSPSGERGSGSEGRSDDSRPLSPRGHGSEGRSGYRGQPILKPPVWTWEVPLYFFVGGLAGMAAALALAGRVAGGSDQLVRVALALAAGGALVSPVLLIMDLGRPARFFTMLRVFKHRSPMSVGVWVLSAFGTTVMPAALLAWLVPGSLDGGAFASLAAGLLTLFLVPAALAGVVVATYTGVLLGATAIPVWIEHRALLPVHFGAAALGSAVAAIELLGPRPLALGGLGLLAAAVETVLFLSLELRHRPPIDRPLREGRSGLQVRLGGGLTGPASLLLRLLGWTSGAALVFLAGALVSRYGWMGAGRASARDPEAALALGR